MTRGAVALLRAPVAALAAAASLHAGAAGACEPALRGDGVARVEGRRAVVAWRAEPQIRTSEFFTLDVAVCLRDAAGSPIALRVDARMPEHNHGMNYRPRVTARGSGRFDVTGMLLHMHGRWQLSFAVQAGDVAETLHADVMLK